MMKVGVDLFELNGHHYIIMIDRFSGWPFCQKLRRIDTSAIIAAIEPTFMTFGFPVELRSDGGPQFRSEFTEYLTANGVIHETSSPYNSQSNGLAEAAVRNVKTLLKKAKTYDNFQMLLKDFRNCPRQDGISPAQMFLGRRLKGQLPVLPSHLLPSPQLLAAGQEARQNTLENARSRRDASATPLTTLTAGQRVRIQDEKTKTWEGMGTITSLQHSDRSYKVLHDNGTTYTRNRRFLRPDNSRDLEAPPAQNTDKEEAIAPPALRRSERLKTSNNQQQHGRQHIQDNSHGSEFHH